MYKQQLDLCRLLDTGAVPLDVAKVFMCGDYGVGKTTLLDTLASQRHLEAHEQPPDEPDRPDERTAGIQVSQLNLTHSQNGCSDDASSSSSGGATATTQATAQATVQATQAQAQATQAQAQAAITAMLRVFDFGNSPPST